MCRSDRKKRSRDRKDGRMPGVVSCIPISLTESDAGQLSCVPHVPSLDTYENKRLLLGNG